MNTRLAEYIASATNARDTTLTVGLCGAQGSGKSTTAAALKVLLEARGLTVAVISIDDLYLTRAERLALAESIHPLLRTRGVPGTHDVALGIETLRALATPGVVAIPSFDKSRDDRRPRELWPTVHAPVKVIILEGWCVGAAPQDDAALLEPVNTLERQLDADATWRRFVNRSLARTYPQLFAMLDLSILLAAPDFDIVYRWRLEQEHQLREQVAAQGGDLSRVMDDLEVRRFISHYERLTRHILQELPARANVLVRLDEQRKALSISFK